MTYSHKLKLSIASGAVLALSLGMFVLPVQAVTVSASASTTAGAKQTARVQTIITKANSDIDARITALNNLNTRIAAMKNVSVAQKSSIAAGVQINITGLTALKAKIDADTDLTTLTADAKEIFGTFRIYALVEPQGYIIAASDRVITIGTMMASVSGKFNTRISAAQSAGQNVTALLTALNDMNLKIVDAEAKANLAATGVASLVPDQGNKTTLASNHAALLAARANIKTATADLKTARTDAATIVKGLKGMKVGATASTTAQ